MRNPIDSLKLSFVGPFHNHHLGVLELGAFGWRYAEQGDRAIPITFGRRRIEIASLRSSGWLESSREVRRPNMNNRLIEGSGRSRPFRHDEALEGLGDARPMGARHDARMAAT